MRMGSGGASSSYMSPNVKTSDNGSQTWEEYIKDKLTRDKILEYLKDKNGVIPFNCIIEVDDVVLNGEQLGAKFGYLYEYLGEIQKKLDGKADKNDIPLIPTP